MSRLLFIFALATFSADNLLAQASTGSHANSRDCISCHEDPHQGTLGTDCASCHDEQTFRPATRFDHDRTAFALTGAHKQLKCSMCHVTEMRNGKPFTRFVGLKFQLCTDCHHDAHSAQFTVDNLVEDCGDCHNVDGFELTMYTIAAHNKTRFPLTGSHLAISCKACHYRNDEWQFTSVGTRCIDCHSNVHGDELTSRFLPGDSCSVCHSAASWDDVTFNHDRTDFKLIGKHTSVGCRSCHFQKDSVGTARWVFRSLDPECETCHKDIHFGQFAVVTADGRFTECTRCHTVDNWLATRFDHDGTAFPLTGAHANVPCLGCHKRVIAGKNIFVKYKLRTAECASCHS